MQDDAPQYYSSDAFVYTRDWALAVDDVWNGVDVLERQGISLDAIANTLAWDWEIFVVALAQIGWRRT
jgi:hypothetical protein